MPAASCGSALVFQDGGFSFVGLNKPPVSLKSYLAQHRREIVLTVLCALVTVGINLLMPYVMRVQHQNNIHDGTFA